MKEATLANGVCLTAGPDCPAEALCPFCGRPVFLRNRQQMGTSDRTYFWQHERGTSSRDCRPQRMVRRSVSQVES